MQYFNFLQFPLSMSKLRSPPTVDGSNFKQIKSVQMFLNGPLAHKCGIYARIKALYMNTPKPSVSGAYARAGDRIIRSTTHVCAMMMTHVRIVHQFGQSQ